MHVPPHSIITHGTAPTSFDLFCRVIDNYGDVGVCWRLARQLSAHPFRANVRLWIDDLHRCAALVPGIHPTAALQTHDNVQVLQWHTLPVNLVPADVVIEAFACDPPPAYLQAITPRQIWINLEYLSAESWVEGCHGLASPQPGGLQKRFFFPGFTPFTGGLLREPDLLARRDAWLRQPEQRWQLLQTLGVPPDAIQALQHGALQLFLFHYPDAPVASLLQALRATGQRAVILSPPGMLPEGLQALGDNDALWLCQIPFVSQAQFDPLLWGSDLNCVRGEDSLVRALWAGKPLLWHIYPQDEEAHLDKLRAWLARSPYSDTVGQAMLAWNTAAGGGTPDAQVAALAASLAPTPFSAWRSAARQWCTALSAQQDLANALVAFCTEQRQNG